MGDYRNNWCGSKLSHPTSTYSVPEAGQPTAAIMVDDQVIVDYSTYWVTCRNLQEASYRLAIINSDTLYNAVTR